MNHSVAKSILFQADFDREGKPTESTQAELDDCIRAAMIWRARVTILHVRPKSERIRWSPDYDNSPAQRTARRIDYALTGMVRLAEQSRVSAQTQILYGDPETVIAQELHHGNQEVLWADVADRFGMVVPNGC